MKTVKTLQLFLSFAFIFFCLTACDKEDETLSPLENITLEGDATTLKIDMRKTNWSIDNITELSGPVFNDLPKSLEGLGTLYFRWGSIVRDKEDALTVNVNENFDKEDRGIIITLKTKGGFYTENITIRQKQCLNFYHITSIYYTLEEGDGIKEAPSRDWGITHIDKSGEEGVATQITFYPIFNSKIYYTFERKISDIDLNSISPDQEDRMVNLPKDIENGRIVFEEEKYVYTDKGMYFNQMKGDAYEMDLMPWKRNKYSGEIHYKRLQVSYTMNLVRADNTNKKTVKGKLLKEFPYDCSPIRCEVSDLQEGD